MEDAPEQLRHSLCLDLSLFLSPGKEAREEVFDDTSTETLSEELVIEEDPFQLKVSCSVYKVILTDS